jgi:hypothetical protein
VLIRLLALALLAPGSVAATESPAPRVLVTGDSMVEPLDRQLGAAVKRAGGRAFRDPRPGTGLTRPLILDWVRHARRQAKRHRPRATVMFIGANDSAALRAGDGREVECCRRAWIAAYADRVERMMRIYRRGSRAWVYWVTLPMPRGREHWPRFKATNLAIAQAGEAAGERVRVVDTIPALSPGNRYRRRVEYRGRTVTVRDKDGVHLTVGGSRIVRDLVTRAMRADGVT